MPSSIKLPFLRGSRKRNSKLAKSRINGASESSAQATDKKVTNGALHSQGNREPEERPRVLIVGAGSRGGSYARSMILYTSAIIHGVAEPVEFKRREFGRKFIWHTANPAPGQSFNDWREWIVYEEERRRREAAGEDVEPGVDAVLVCTLDSQHAEAVIAIAKMDVHIMCEKPLATTLEDCLAIYRALDTGSSHEADATNKTGARAIFSIGHVLRYSPHNVLLRRLLLQDRVVGDILSVEHTEPVGFWHFPHSYVRGNWRRESTTAPSLLTKSCHDIDAIMWLLCSPEDPEDSSQKPHMPSRVMSMGRLNQFRKARKPKAAGSATNCLSCPIESDCTFSAKKLYGDRLAQGNFGWPVKIVNPEIEECCFKSGPQAAWDRLMQDLSEDYDENTPDEQIKARNWFGRCVWDSDNDVCDDQTVTISWDDSNTDPAHKAKTATFHMIAQTQALCERRGRVYGETGELHYDSCRISVYSFATQTTKVYDPRKDGSADNQASARGHGGGDDGLARQFIRAVEAVKFGGSTVDAAQRKFVGCTLEEVVRSHAMVFAAEEARCTEEIVNWQTWWGQKLQASQKLAEAKPVSQQPEQTNGHLNGSLHTAKEYAEKVVADMMPPVNSGKTVEVAS